MNIIPSANTKCASTTALKTDSNVHNSFTAAILFFLQATHIHAIDQ